MQEFLEGMFSHFTLQHVSELRACNLLRDGGSLYYTTVHYAINQSINLDLPETYRQPLNTVVLCPIN